MFLGGVLFVNLQAHTWILVNQWTSPHSEHFCMICYNYTPGKAKSNRRPPFTKGRTPVKPCFSCYLRLPEGTWRGSWSPNGWFSAETIGQQLMESQTCNIFKLCWTTSLDSVEQRLRPWLEVTLHLLLLGLYLNIHVLPLHTSNRDAKLHLLGVHFPSILQFQNQRKTPPLRGAPWNPHVVMLQRYCPPSWGGRLLAMAWPWMRMAGWRYQIWLALTRCSWDLDWRASCWIFQV